MTFAELNECGDVDLVARMLEAALHVTRRPQFFVWSQNHVQQLLSHKVMVCGLYQRSKGALVFEAFNSIALSDALMCAFSDASSPLMRRLQLDWALLRGKPLGLDVQELQGDEWAALRADLRSAGLGVLWVHGVARPQRPSEVESLFVFGAHAQGEHRHALRSLEMIVPQLHSTWLRVQSLEREAPLSQSLARAQARGASHGITERERQILSGVREGLNNQQIAEALNISPLTVKNHVQKILRKLGASNRAQAVACAMSSDLGLHQGRADESVWA